MNLKDKRGETLVETVFSLMIISLTAAALATAVLYAEQIMNRIDSGEARLEEEAKAVEIAKEMKNGTLTVICENGETEIIDITVTGREGGILGYLLNENGNR